MKRYFTRTTVFLLVLALAACNLPGSPEETVPAATMPAATLPAATMPVDPTPTQPMPTLLPIPTNTGIPAGTPNIPVSGTPEAIYIAEPGPGSRVTLPVRVAGLADPTFEQSLVVTILLADGTELITTSTQIQADVGQRGPFVVEVPLTITEEQQGFIQVYAISPKDGGTTHLSSVGVTLAPSGSANIVPAPERPEQLTILQPGIGETIVGGVVRVLGYGIASFEQTLVIDVLDETGNVIATTPVMVESEGMGQPGPFRADIAYSVPAANNGRVVVRDVSMAHGGDSHVTSVEVNLMP